MAYVRDEESAGSNEVAFLLCDVERKLARVASCADER